MQCYTRKKLRRGILTFIASKKAPLPILWEVLASEACTHENELKKFVGDTELEEIGWSPGIILNDNTVRRISRTIKRLQKEPTFPQMESPEIIALRKKTQELWEQEITRGPMLATKTLVTGPQIKQFISRTPGVRFKQVFIDDLAAVVNNVLLQGKTLV